jgi:hypothetical protein
MTRAQVEKFQQLYREEFGVDLPYNEALENAVKLVEIVREVYKPINKADYQKFINP